jgi:HK97 family phage portal protein
MGFRAAWRALWGQKASGAGFLHSLYSIGQPKWTPRKYDEFAKEGYQRNVIAYRCIQLIAAGAASVPWLLYQGENEVEDENHELLKLLKRPNPQQGGADLFEAWYAFELIAGNSYMEAVGPDMGPPKELYALRPDRMKVIPSNLGTPAAYEYQVGSLKRSWQMNPLTGEGPILHIKRFNPLDDWYGMSPIEAAAYGIDQHNSAGAWNQALLQNSARPSGMLSAQPKEGPPTLTDEQFNRLKSEIDEKFSGPANAGRPMLGEGGLVWQEMAWNPKDMDWMNGRNLSARDICAAFGVPSMLVNVEGDATYANYKEARLALWEDTICPLIDRRVDALNNWLVPKFGEDLRLGYDEDAISALGPKREELWARVDKATFLSINEKRAAVGYDDVEGGDDVLVPSTSLPASFGGIPPEPPAADPKKAGKLAYGE